MSLVGRWRIVEMEHWAQEDVDLDGPGFIEFSRNHTGSFGFIAVEGVVGWRDVSRDGHHGVEFYLEGHDEGDQASGRGWAVRDDDGSLRGHIYFHPGDDSGFRAEPVDDGRPKPKDTLGASRGRR